MQDESTLTFLPLMIAGGYRVGNMEKLFERTKARLQQSGVEISDDKLQEHLRLFVSQIEQDMRHRQQYARLDPLLPYAPEPNLFLDATAVMSGRPSGARLAFGPKGAEFTEMGKNVSRFAADELETLFTERHGEIMREMPEDSPERRAKVEELNNELLIMSQTHRHPIREIDVHANFEKLTVETDLSRLAASAYTDPRTAQSHAGLTTAVDRFFQTKEDKKGSEASKAQKEFFKQLQSLRSIQELDPLNKRWKGKTFKTGKKMSEALSVRYKRGGLFSAMTYGVQPELKKLMLRQIAIEQDMRALMDAVAKHAAFVQNFQQQAYPLHGTNTQLRVAHWTVADGDCGVYALGDLIQQPDLTREGLVAHLLSLGTDQANAAAGGISGRNNNLWLSWQQVAEIGQLLGLADIAIVTFNLQTNTWAVLHGDPSTSNHIIGGVPASLGGPINHWVVLRR